MDKWLSRFGFDRVSSTWWAKKDRGVLVKVMVVPVGATVELWRSGKLIGYETLYKDVGVWELWRMTRTKGLLKRFDKELTRAEVQAILVGREYKVDMDKFVLFNVLEYVRVVDGTEIRIEMNDVDGKWALTVTLSGGVKGEVAVREVMKAYRPPDDVGRSKRALESLLDDLQVKAVELGGV